SIVDEKAGEVVLGASTRHLMQVAAFAADLVGRGRLLPTVDAPHPRALWRPLLTGPDLAWAQSLVLALPPAGRASADPAPAVVAAALDALVDAAVRLALLAGGTDRTVDAAADGTTPAARWLTALSGPHRTFAASPDEVVDLVRM